MNERFILTDEEKEVINEVIERCRGIFDALQKEQIYLGFVNGLTLEQVQVYAKPELPSEQMYLMRIEIQSKTK